MWHMLQLEAPEDFVIATGEMHSVREFLDKAFAHIGKEIEWEGSGDTEIGKEKGTDIVRVKVNPKYYRPTDVEQLLGDPSKAKKAFGWSPKVSFDELVKDMMDSDIELMKTRPNA
jgi:GDPmannose 4,6-dehydratase